MIKLVPTGRLPLGVSLPPLQQAVREVYRQTGFTINGEIGLQFVGKNRSRELNRTYAGHDYATDVLSFDYETSQAPVLKRRNLPLGDIVICTPIARRQAREHATSLQAEVSLLTVHGTLHILGFDHQTQTGQASFAQLQNAIMEAMKLPSREYFHGHVHEL